MNDELILMLMNKLSSVSPQKDVDTFVTSEYLSEKSKDFLIHNLLMDECNRRGLDIYEGLSNYMEEDYDNYYLCFIENNLKRELTEQERKIVSILFDMQNGYARPFGKKLIGNYTKSTWPNDVFNYSKEWAELLIIMFKKHNDIKFSEKE
jgi:hypothetical protein